MNLDDIVHAFYRYTCFFFNLHPGGLNSKYAKKDDRPFVQELLDDVIINWKRSHKGQPCRPSSDLYYAVLEDGHALSFTVTFTYRLLDAQVVCGPQQQSQHDWSGS